MPSLQSLQFATFQQRQHPSSRTKLMMTNGSHSHILTPTQQTHTHTHTRTHAHALSLSLSHSLPSDAHSISHSLTLARAWLSHDICHASTHQPMGCPFHNLETDRPEFSSRRLYSWRMTLCWKTQTNNDHNKGGFIAQMQRAYFILTLRPLVRFSAFLRIFLLMLLRTVDRVLDIGKLVLVHQKPILNGFKVQALGSVMAHRTSLKKLLSMLPIKTLLSD